MKISKYPKTEVLEDEDVLIVSKPQSNANVTKGITAKSLAENIGGNVAQAIKDEILAAVGEVLYPVGSIYISVNDTDPTTLFGGEWEAIHGRFLVAEGSNGETGNALLNLTAGASGGETNHTLTLNEMPNHYHAMGIYVSSNEAANYGLTQTSSFRNRVMVSGGSNTGAAGGSQAHNNLPPYLAVYMWKRTA